MKNKSPRTLATRLALEYCETEVGLAGVVTRSSIVDILNRRASEGDRDAIVVLGTLINGSNRTLKGWYKSILILEYRSPCHNHYVMSLEDGNGD